MSVRIRFIRGMGWDSKFIEWGSRSWCSHAEYIDYTFGVTFGAQLNGGVKWRSVKNPCYWNVSKSETWELPSNLPQNLEINKFINTTCNLPYDWRAIVSFALGERDWREPDSWFCSEWCARMLEVAGITKIPDQEPLDRIDPMDLYLILSQIPGARVIQKWEK